MNIFLYKPWGQKYGEKTFGKKGMHLKKKISLLLTKLQKIMVWKWQKGCNIFSLRRAHISLSTFSSEEKP